LFIARIIQNTTGHTNTLRRKNESFSVKFSGTYRRSLGL